MQSSMDDSVVVTIKLVKSDDWEASLYKMTPRDLLVFWTRNRERYSNGLQLLLKVPPLPPLLKT